MKLTLNPGLESNLMPVVSSIILREDHQWEKNLTYHTGSKNSGVNKTANLLFISYLVRKYLAKILTYLVTI